MERPLAVEQPFLLYCTYLDKFAQDAECNAGEFSPPKTPSSHTKYVANPNFGIPAFGLQNRHIKIPPTYFRFDAPLLEILPSGYMPSMSTNSIMSFHIVDPKLLHCFSWLHKFGLRSASLSNICWFAPLSLGSIWRLPFLYAQLKHRVLSAYVLSLREHHPW